MQDLSKYSKSADGMVSAVNSPEPVVGGECMNKELRKRSTNANGLGMQLLCCRTYTKRYNRMETCVLSSARTDWNGQRQQWAEKASRLPNVRH